MNRDNAVSATYDRLFFVLLAVLSQDGEQFIYARGGVQTLTRATYGPEQLIRIHRLQQIVYGPDFETAKAQLQDFILKLNGKGDDSFYKWIQEICDVPLLLRTYAVNVVCGMWDDYWNNCNNYYIYFNTTDRYNYKFFFIPYDYDNTLGTSSMMDSGRQDPFNWGNNSNPLIYRLLKFADFREIYREALLELVDESSALFYYTASMERIKGWQNQVKDYVSNDTGEDCVIEDRPASWGNHGEYRLLETGSNNYFQVKTETINRYCK